MTPDATPRSRFLIPALVVALALPITPVRLIMGWAVTTLHVPAAATEIVAQLWMWVLAAIVLALWSAGRCRRSD